MAATTTTCSRCPPRYPTRPPLHRCFHLAYAQLIFELRGKPPNKFLRKGAFRDEYFDENFSFLFQDVDKVTRAVCCFPLLPPSQSLLLHNALHHLLPDRQAKTVTIPTMLGQDLTTLLPATERGDAGRKKLLQFKDLLERMLAVDPDRRLAPPDALKHPFIAEPMTE
jgi:serine/threonine-protein kinase PRP4